MPGSSPASSLMLLLVFACFLSLIGPILCLHQNCPTCQGLVELVPFDFHCAGPLTCRCGSPVGQEQCMALKKGIHQTCQKGCGWRDTEYRQLCQVEDHIKPCQYFPHASDSSLTTTSASFEAARTSLRPTENHHQEPIFTHEAHPSLTTAPYFSKSGSTMSGQSSFNSKSSGRSTCFNSEPASPQSSEDTPRSSESQDPFLPWEVDFKKYELENVMESLSVADEPNILKKK